MEIEITSVNRKWKVEIRSSWCNTGLHWTARTWQHLAMHLITQQMPPCRDTLWSRASRNSQCEESGAKIRIAAVAPTEAQQVLQLFTLICQHLHRQGIANMRWYDEAGQSPRTGRTDLAVRKSVSDSLIWNMHTSRQPEMVFRALQCSCPVPPHTEGADTDPAAGHHPVSFSSYGFAHLLHIKSHIHDLKLLHHLGCLETLYNVRKPQIKVWPLPWFP